MLSQARSQGSGAVTLNAQARQRVEQYLNEAQRQIQANQHDEAAEQVEHAEAAIRAEARQAQGEERQQLRRDIREHGRDVYRDRPRRF